MSSLVWLGVPGHEPDRQRVLALQEKPPIRLDDPLPKRRPEPTVLLTILRDPELAPEEAGQLLNAFERSRPALAQANLKRPVTRREHRQELGQGRQRDPFLAMHDRPEGVGD